MPRQATPNSSFAFDPDRGAFLGLEEDAIIAASGPIEARRAPASDGPSFFAPDFFLRTDKPWWIPEQHTRFSRASFSNDDRAAPEISWSEPDRDEYARMFASLRQHLETSSIRKATPVTFAEGRITGPEPARRFAPFLAAKAIAAPSPSIPFGIWDRDGGIVGATPELLFRVTRNRTVETMALAGTTALEDADKLLDDPKERDEHQFVIDAINESLAPFGTVEVGETTVLRLPTLAHLLTPIRVPTVRDADFESLTAALHPTPALGGTPRDAAVRWLESQDATVRRGRFGAPFGLRNPDGSGVCVVAIRAIKWRDQNVRLGSGAGVIAASDLDREWAELVRKRAAVKRMFAL